MNELKRYVYNPRSKLKRKLICLNEDLCNIRNKDLYEFYCSAESIDKFLTNLDEKIFFNQKNKLFNYIYNTVPEYLTSKWTFPIIPNSYKNEFINDPCVNNVIFMNEQLYQSYINKIEKHVKFEFDFIYEDVDFVNESLKHKIKDVFVYVYDITLELESFSNKNCAIRSIHDIKNITDDHFEEFNIDMLYNYCIVFEIYDKDINYLKLDGDFFENYMNNFDSYFSKHPQRLLERRVKFIS